MAYWGSYPAYVPIAQRRANAKKELAALEKKGHKAAPIEISGRQIATTFWGKAWCDHLESFSDYANRLPRGRTYVRNGSVVDLQIEPGRIEARVAGSSLYTVNITITQTPAAAWNSIKQACAGQISSLIDLLKGKLAAGVMKIIAAREGGLFPLPKEIELDCSCPDGAYMCKHIAAVLYGVGARLDAQPELLFLLRKLDHLELIQSAATAPAIHASAGTSTLAESELSEVFGIELEGQTPPAAPSAPGEVVKAAAPVRAKGKSAHKRAVIAKAGPTSKKKQAKASRPKAGPGRRVLTSGRPR